MTKEYHEPEIKSILGISQKFNLTNEDLSNRGTSFLDENILRLGGIRRVSDDQGHQILGISTRQKGTNYNGIAIPYFDFQKMPYVMEWTIRRDAPKYDENGKGEIKEKRKYVKPFSSKNLLYIPPMMPLDLLKDKKKPIVFFEGEFKALAGARVATNDFTSDEWTSVPVGISGVDNFKTKQKRTTPDGNKDVSAGLSEFNLIEWKGRSIIICFDSDIDEKPNVKQARMRFTRFLREKGAKVFYTNFPKEYEGIETKGFDDYLGAVAQIYGKDAAIRAGLEIIEQAQKPQAAFSPIAENFTLIENGEIEPGVYDSPGLYFEDEERKFWICSPIKVVAETQTETGEHYGRLLEWRDSQNRLHRWAMPIEFVHSEGADLAKYLASNGLEIMPARKFREQLAYYIATSKSSKTTISTDKIGWHGECYVLPNKTFGDCENEIVYQTEYEGHHNFKVCGALEDWQENISKYCQGNSRLLFAVSVGFAAPLLPVVQMQGGGFHFRGSTSTGKTTALLTSGSVWGGDEEHGFLQTWKATANGLEIIAAGHNHALLCLDEIGECESKEIGNVAYMLANGRGKARMTKTLQARHSLTWNLMFLSTGEQSLSDKILESGGTVKGGQEIRLVDIEADTGKFGLFENLHNFPSGQALSDHLRASACIYYGEPVRYFLNWLSETDFADIRTNWHGLKDAFIDDVLPDKEKVPSEVFRVAARFALVALGGEMATEAGLTQWERGEASAAAKTIFLQWLNGREGGGQTDEERAIRQVRAFLEQHGASRFQNLKYPDEKVSNRAGFLRKNETTNQTEYLILPEAMKREVCKGLNCVFAANALNGHGFLDAGTKELSKVVHISKELGSMRVYVVRDMLSENGQAAGANN